MIHLESSKSSKEHTLFETQHFRTFNQINVPLQKKFNKIKIQTCEQQCMDMEALLTWIKLIGYIFAISGKINALKSDFLLLK